MKHILLGLALSTALGCASTPPEPDPIPQPTPLPILALDRAPTGELLLAACSGKIVEQGVMGIDCQGESPVWLKITQAPDGITFEDMNLAASKGIDQVVAKIDGQDYEAITYNIEADNPAYSQKGLVVRRAGPAGTFFLECGTTAAAWSDALCLDYIGSLMDINPGTLIEPDGGALAVDFLGRQLPLSEACASEGPDNIRCGDTQMSWFSRDSMETIYAERDAMLERAVQGAVSRNGRLVNAQSNVPCTLDGAPGKCKTAVLDFAMPEGATILEIWYATATVRGQNAVLLCSWWRPDLQEGSDLPYPCNGLVKVTPAAP